VNDDTNVNVSNSENTKEDLISPPRVDEPEPARTAEIPLFLRDSSEGNKGDAQDEKDKSAE